MTNSRRPKKHTQHQSASEDPCVALRGLRRHAPAGFTGRVMRGLSDRDVPALRPAVWPSGWSWIPPALAGAAAAVLMTLFFTGSGPFRGDAADGIVVQFEFHAPHAEQVELVGDFTAWQPGQILLVGPDESGHWTARIELPAGRYEYLFLVDGAEWVTDPHATARRPDGFGNLNAVLNL